MTELPYLVRLGARLNEGLQNYSDVWKDRHAGFLLQAEMPDGGFRGREGDSDLYYTSFAVRGLWMLNRLTPDVVGRVSGYLRSSWSPQMNALDFMNWISTGMALQFAGGESLVEDERDFQATAATRLESTRTADGGYAKSVSGASGSTYQSFLVLLAYQLLGVPLPRPNALLQFVFDRQRDDGGFVEISQMKRSGTNPTAAAAAILQELNSLDRQTRSDIEGFLREVRNVEEGGFQANTRIPFSDSLSTFTAVLTAQNLKLRASYSSERVHRWIETDLEFPTGGFRAAAWDNNADVEYSFYGMGLLSLLQMH